VSQIRPRDISKSELEMIKNFEEMCLLIQKEGNVIAKNMTIMEFYTMMSLVKKKKI
jgi:pectate lyase